MSEETIGMSGRSKQSSRALATGGAARPLGFTLIELMITVAVVAILAAIAIPSYQFAVVKSRRNVAQTCLAQAAQFMERYYTAKLTYVDGTPPACTESSNATYYTLNTGTPTASTFTMTMTPKGTQATREKDCGTMTIDQSGAKTASITGGKCW